jgi:hypothetical protein
MPRTASWKAPGVGRSRVADDAQGPGVAVRVFSNPRQREARKGEERGSYENFDHHRVFAV